MSASLVGSEMCIRDRARRTRSEAGPWPQRRSGAFLGRPPSGCFVAALHTCLLYTSDAADDM
eukprot:12621023-Alexandrium_andersonii.AAC.1